MFGHISEAVKSPDFVQLDTNLYIARFESMKLYSTLFAVKKLLSDGVINQDTVLIDSSSGIYAYALALACHKYGLKCHIIVSHAADKTIIAQLELLGACVESVPSAGGVKFDQNYRVQRVRAIIDSNKNYYWMRQYHNAIHYGGYGEFAALIRQELPCAALILVGGVGSGCSTGATAGFLRRSGVAVRLCGVQPFGSASFGAGKIEDSEMIIAGIGSAIDFLNIRHSYYDSVNWLSFAACLSGSIELLRKYGIFAGLSSGGAFCAARLEARLNPQTPCLMIAPDTGHRYAEAVFRNYNKAVPVDSLQPKNISGAHEFALPWSRLSWARRNKAFAAVFERGGA